jgi:hypothetical protein
MGDLLETVLEAHGGQERVTTTTSRSAAARAQRTTSPTTTTSRASTSHQAQDLPADPDGQSLDEPLIVSIDLSEIEFT